MSNSYVLGIAVGIAFGIIFVAFIFSYLKKKGKDVYEYDERQKLAQLKGWKAAFIAAVCFDIINAAVVEARGPWSGMMVMAICSLYVGVGAYAAVCIGRIHAAAQESGKVYTAPAGACPRQYRHRRAQLPKHRPH